MDYRKYEIRDCETRGRKGFAVHDTNGMLLYRCGDEATARAKIDRIISGEGATVAGQTVT